MQWFVAKLLLITIGNNIISLQIYCNDSDFLYIIGQYLVHTHLSHTCIRYWENKIQRENTIFK